MCGISPAFLGGLFEAVHRRSARSLAVVAVGDLCSDGRYCCRSLLEEYDFGENWYD